MFKVLSQIKNFIVNHLMYFTEKNDCEIQVKYNYQDFNGHLIHTGEWSVKTKNIKYK